MRGSGSGSGSCAVRGGAPEHVSARCAGFDEQLAQSLGMDLRTLRQSLAAVCEFKGESWGHRDVVGVVRFVQVCSPALTVLAAHLHSLTPCGCALPSQGERCRNAHRGVAGRAGARQARACSPHRWRVLTASWPGRTICDALVPLPRTQATSPKVPPAPGVCWLRAVTQRQGSSARLWRTSTAERSCSTACWTLASRRAACAKRAQLGIPAAG